MVVFSTKFNRKRAIVAVVALAVVLVLIIVLAGRRDNSNKSNAQSALSSVVKDNDERVGFLEELGWEVEEQAIEEQSVVIPREFTEVYERYNEIQVAQGFDLSKYAGVEAKRFTYRILNYPEKDISAVADIIVYRNEIIAGDVQSNKLDGFMTGLEYPDS